MLLSTRQPRSSCAGDRARLRIEGVEAAIVTRVARRRSDALVVVQELPFLRMNARTLDEDGRAARISRVAIDCDGEIPKLVLELAYEDAPAEPEHDPVSDGWDRRDQTLGYGEARPSAAEIIRRDSLLPRRERESTLMFRTDPPPPFAGATEPLSTGPESVRTLAPWMEKRGTDLELAWRALVARVTMALDCFARGLVQALAALRTDP